MLTAPPALPPFIAAPVMFTAPAVDDAEPVPVAAVMVVEPETLAPALPVALPLVTIVLPPAAAPADVELEAVRVSPRPAAAVGVPALIVNV